MNVDGTDRTLWDLWRLKRDDGAFEALVQPHLRFAAAFARRLGLGEADADDAVQRSLTRLCSDPSERPVRVGLRAWLGREVLNNARMSLRADRRRRQREGEAAPRDDRPVAPMDVRDEVEAALVSLDETGRQALELRFLHDLEYSEIAHVLGVSRVACRLRVHRALGQLRRRLGPSAAVRLAALPVLGSAGAWRCLAQGVVAGSATTSATATGGLLLMGAGMKVAVGALVLAAGVGLWVLAKPGPSPAPATTHGAREDGTRSGSASLSSDTPELRAREGAAGAGRDAPARRTVQLRITSECGDAPLAGAVCGWGVAGLDSGNDGVRESIAGPTGPDGRLELNVPAPARQGDAAGSRESLLVSAAGYEARPLADLLDGRLDTIDVQLKKVTRIVGEMIWPAGWSGHVRPQMVSVGAAPAREDAPWTARQIKLAEDGRSFEGDVHGCGRFRVIFSYLLDDAEAGATTSVEIDAATGPEVRVTMQPSAKARQPSSEPKHRWTISVTDDRGSPVEGATIAATRSGATHESSLRGTWETNREGDAVREVSAGKYYFTVQKQGWGTAFVSASIEGEHRDAVRLVRATTKLVVTFTQTSSPPLDTVFFQLRQRAPPGDRWDWHPLERSASGQASGRLEFAVVKGQEYAVFASGQEIAPVAELVSRLGPDEHERTLDLVLGAGDRAEVRGLELESTAAPIGVMIQYEGLLGEILTATPRARFSDGRWTIEHLSGAAGQVTADVGGRRLRGSLPASSKEPRVLELR